MPSSANRSIFSFARPSIISKFKFVGMLAWVWVVLVARDLKFPEGPMNESSEEWSRHRADREPIASKASLSPMKPKTLAKCLITAARVIAVISQML